MRRVLVKFLEKYSRYGIRNMYNSEYIRALDMSVVNRLQQRRRFLTPSFVNQVFTSTYRLYDALVSESVSPVDKLLLLSGLRYFQNRAALRACRECALSSIVDYQIGNITLNLLEVTSLIYLILKKFYVVKDQCDMKYYLTHLSQYIPWQSLTHILKRFPSKDRKSILNSVGIAISSYVASDSIIRQEIAISIW